MGIRGVDSRFRFREEGIISSMSVGSFRDSTGSSFLIEASWANREREDRVDRRVPEVVALRIFAVSCEILEVRIVRAGPQA